MFRKSQAVHFNNFQLYKRRREGSMEKSGDREAMETLKGGNSSVIKNDENDFRNCLFCPVGCYYTIEKKKMLTHFERLLM